MRVKRNVYFLKIQNLQFLWTFPTKIPNPKLNDIDSFSSDINNVGDLGQFEETNARIRNEKT